MLRQAKKMLKPKPKLETELALSKPRDGKSTVAIEEFGNVKVNMLGSGGSGVVFTTDDILGDSSIAVKYLLYSEETKLACEREAGFMTKTLQTEDENKQYVIKLIGYFVHPKLPDQFAIAMEHAIYGSQEDLLFKLKVNPSDPIAQALKSWNTRDKIIDQMLKGLYFLKKCEIIHRDIKSANILFTYDYDVRIADFGSACTKQESDAVNSKKIEDRKDDVLVGTWYYWAPEVILGKTYSEKSEMFALGLTIEELLSLRVADIKLSRDVIEKRKVETSYNETFPEIREPENKNYAHLYQLCRRLTLFNPTERPDIEKAMEEKGLSIERPNPIR